MYDNYTPLLEAATVDKIVVIYLSRYTYYLNIIFKQVDSTLIEYYITYIYIYIDYFIVMVSHRPTIPEEPYEFFIHIYP